MRGGSFGKALVHVFGEVVGTEDVTDVDRHDDGRVMEVEWMIGGSFCIQSTYIRGETKKLMPQVCFRYKAFKFIGG